MGHRSTVTLVLVSSFVARVTGQSSSAPSVDPDCLKSCCDEDCCGPSTEWNGKGCVPNVTAPGWNGVFPLDHEEGCVTRTCCEEECCQEGVPFSLVTGRCDGSGLFAFQDAKVVVGVAATEYRMVGQCLPTTAITHVIDAGTSVGMTGAFCDDANNGGRVLQCQSRPEPEKVRFELLELPTSILNQHMVQPGQPIPGWDPRFPPPDCLLFYNLRFSVDCGPAKVQARDGCFNDADGTVVCPIQRVCNNGCFELINRVVDVVPGEEMKSCTTTPLRPGLI